MTIKGKKNIQYVCDLRMEQQIACGHVVTTKCPGLTISQGGAVAEALTYNFPDGQGLVAQGLGWIGSTPGVYPVFCDISSPYFVTPSGLKVKKDTFNLTIEAPAPIGWDGNYAGYRWGSFSSLQWTNPDLVFTFTMPEVGPPRIITFTPSSTVDSTLGVLISGAGNTSRCSGSPSYQMTAAGGSYRFQVFSNGVWSAQNGTPSLPPFSVTASVEGIPGNFPFTTKTAGFIRKDQTPNSSAINSAFTQEFGDIVDSAGATINFAMTSWNFNNEPPAPPSIHFDGSVSAAGNSASASGSWKDGGVPGFGPYSLNANFQYTGPSGLQVGYTVRLIRVV